MSDLCVISFIEENLLEEFKTTQDVDLIKMKVLPIEEIANLNQIMIENKVVILGIEPESMLRFKVRILDEFKDKFKGERT